jgi:hypothetical protein
MSLWLKLKNLLMVLALSSLSLGMVGCGGDDDDDDSGSGDNGGGDIVEAPSDDDSGSGDNDGGDTVEAPFDVDLYVRGGMQDDWGAVEEQKFVFADGKYSVNVNLSDGTYQWKIADDAWAVVNCGAAVQEVDDFPPALDVSLDDLAPGWQGNCDSKSPNNFNTTFTPGTYTFEADFSADEDNPIITVSLAAADEPTFGETDLYIRGSMQDDWGAVEEQMLAYAGAGVYSATITMAEGSAQWKIADDAWAVINCGAAVQETDDFPPPLDVTLEQLVDWKGNCDSKSPNNFQTEFAAGDYTFSADFGDDEANPIINVALVPAAE